MNDKKEQELYFQENDKLGLATYANNIKRIIEACGDFPKSNDNEAYVIGIDSPWGKLLQTYCRLESQTRLFISIFRPPAKGVVGVNPSESSNLSFSAEPL